MRFTLAALSVVALPMLAAACSEPVPQTPDGAFFFQTIQDDPLKCQIAGQKAAVGIVDQNQKNTVILDGTNGTEVDCTVLGTAAPFEVHAKMDDSKNTGNYLEILIPKISPSAKKDSPATGSVVMSAPFTASTYTGEGCNFYFEEGTKQTVASGRIWVTFDCPALSSGMSTCPIKVGYAIFENCLTVSTEEEE